MNTYNKIALGNWNGCRGCFLLSRICDKFVRKFVIYSEHIENSAFS